MIDVVIDNRLRMRAAALASEVREALQDEFTYNNPAWFKAKAMGRWPGGIDKQICTWDESAEEFSLPRGGIARMRDIFEQHGVEHDEIDRRTRGNPSLKPYTGDWVTPQIIPPHNRELWAHQDKIVDLFEKRTQALVHAATSSGKTTALLAAIARIQLPAMVIVWDTKLLDQWQQRIREEMGIPLSEIGLVQGKVRRLRPITMAMQQTLNQMPAAALREVAGNFGVVAGDEIQRAAATTYTHTYDAFSSMFRIGVSENSRRKDGKHFLIKDLFGDVALEITADEVVKAGHRVDVAVHMVLTEFDAPWYREIIEANKERRRGQNEDDDEPRVNPDFVRLVDQMTNDDARTRLLMEFVAAKVQQQGERFLVFTHRVQHARAMDAMLTGFGIRSGLMVGGKENEAEYMQTKTALIAGHKSAGVGTYQAIGVGQDIPTVTAGMATTPIHSNQGFTNQVRGRLARKPEGKERATLYYAYDRKLYGAAPLRAMMRLAHDVRVVDDERPGALVPASQFINERRAYEAQSGQQTLSGIVDTVGARRPKRAR